MYRFDFWCTLFIHTNGYYTLRKECNGYYVDFPHTLRFFYFPHRLEVENSSHNLMWLVRSFWFAFSMHNNLADYVDYPPQNKISRMKSFSIGKVRIGKELLILCGISNACRSMWKLYIITIISLVEWNFITTKQYSYSWWWYVFHNPQWWS